jgi:electron transport complex protein RnfG
MFKTGWLLAIFAVVSTGMLAYTYENTKEQVAINQREFLLHTLHALVPPTAHDNDLYSDTITVRSPEYLGSREPVTVYRARKQGAPVAVILSIDAPDGYSGDIHLLVAIAYDGTVLGVRVASHKETPGLGDAIEVDRSNWILGFNGKSLDNPDEKGWHVKKDGGVFDQFTGATITPRAVVKAVHKSLKYFAEHRDELFARPPQEAPSHG